MPLIDKAGSKMAGHVLVRDAATGEILLDKMNAIHHENLSEAIALSLMNFETGHIHEMVFGNGASTVSGTGAITYLAPNVVGADAQLYNETFRKIVDNRSPLMPEGEGDTNKIEMKHIAGNVFTDIVITCTLNHNEPEGQEAFDDTTNLEGQFVFDELGLKAYHPSVGEGRLLTHVIFHPIQKSLNRVIEIIYTLRIYMT
jgi:hypothetical protein